MYILLNKMYFTDEGHHKSHKFDLFK